MGDIADYLIEQGEDQYFAHLRGECEDICPYCEATEVTKKEGE